MSPGIVYDVKLQHGLVATSDVKFHEIFWREIFYEIFGEIFLKYFKKFHDGLLVQAV